MVGHRTRWMIAVMVVGATLLVATPAGASSEHARPSVAANSGALSDLSLHTADVTDGARAGAFVLGRPGRGTIVVLGLWGLDRSAAGTRYGAHVHVGACVPGDGAAAGPHYNTTGGATVDPSTEVWLDFEVRRSGSAVAVAQVPFVIPAGGARSIVIHAMPTMPNGTAGARLACLPLEF